MIRRIPGAIALVCVAAVVSASRAADAPPAEVVSMRVDAAAVSVSADTLDVVMRIDIAEGWHINAHEPTYDWLIPTVLTVDPPSGFRVGEIRYPEPETMAFAFAGGKSLAVYSGTVHLTVPLTAESVLRPEGVTFRSRLRYQACDDERCLRPAEIERDLVVTTSSPEGASTGVDEARESASIEGWLAQYGLLPTLFLVALLGLGLNLTPCVYPLVSVTLAFFGGQSRTGHPRTHLVALASVYALGIALTFSFLGVSAALSGSLFGATLQNPVTLVAVALLLVALAASNFGLYTLRPPSWLLQKAGAAGVAGFGGAFFMGLTMGIVAAPCVGPIVVGLLVTVGALADPVIGFLLFFALAVGLGLPYVALGAFAGSLSGLPRSGEWLVWVEHLFGVLLLGMALWFVSPLLPRGALAWAIPLFVAGAGLGLGFLDPNGSRLRGFAVARQVFGAAAVLLAVWLALPSGTRDGVTWTVFSDAALAEARAEGRPAVVDFRADWCLPCIEMEHTTFVDPEVVRQTGDFAMLQADVTAMSRENEALLDRHKVLGVPTTIFYDRQGRERRRVVGYINPEEFLRLLGETGGTAAATAVDAG